MTEAYAALLTLIEREHALIAAGEFEQLSAIDTQRRALLAGMPAPAPDAAHPLLRHAVAVQERTIALLRASIGEIERELGRLAHGRVAVRGYGADASARAGRLDLAG